MSGYVRFLVKDIETKIELSPGVRFSFNMNDNSPKLEDHNKKFFQSMTVKLLYLAKRFFPMY
jgi:hypothetical protein